jgi:uncharacterized protein (TIGR03435 family)
MRKLFALATLLATFAASAICQPATDIAGNWQGTLEFPASGSQPGLKVRIVLKIAKAADGTLTALNYAIDQSPDPMTTAGVSLQGNTFRYSVPSLHGSYEAQLNADATAMTGNWTQGRPLPLILVRATKEIAWEIPAPRPPPKPMAADADPSFEVATIKPSAAGNATKIIRVNGRSYQTKNTSLADLIQVAYGLHQKQIVDAPAWVAEEKFDLVAVPDGEGQPSLRQWLTMVQKLLADRFGLTFHHAMRDLSVYVLSIAKDGPRNLVKSATTSPFPTGLEFHPVPGGVMMPAGNATTGQFSQMMQQVVLDRPVVDHTGLTDRFDFQLTFVPDDSQFNGHPPAFPTAAAAANAIPGLFEALQQQLGLKLSAEKVPTDVLVVDQVHKPSLN